MSNQTSFYKFCINNTALFLRSQENRDAIELGILNDKTQEPLTALKAAEVLAIALVADKSKVLADLLAAQMLSKGI